MLLFQLEFQPPPASLKLTEVAFDTVRTLGVKFSKISSHAFALIVNVLPSQPVHFTSGKSLPNSANESFSCSLNFVVRLVLKAMLH